MTDFSRNYDFSTKDALATGNPSKLIKGSEVDAEFDDIAAMSATKTNKAVPAVTNNVATLSSTGDLQDSGLLTSEIGIASGTRMLFQQTAAPTGWTKVTSGVDDKALRVVSGSVSSGGSVAFSTAFGTTATDAHTLTAAQSGLPAHNHTTQYALTGGSLDLTTGSTKNTSGVTGTNSAQDASQGHTHGIDLQVTYLDVIVATKD